MSSDHGSRKTDNGDEDRSAVKIVAPKIVQFEELASCGNEVWIQKGGQLYRLQQTRQGKLILTK